MSVPEELVQAAAEAPCLGAGKVNTGLLRGVVSCKGQRTKHPECALAAVFAALPECKEAQPSMPAGQKRMGWNDCLNFLAREFGEPT